MSQSFAQLLDSLREGDPEAADRVFARVYGELCRLASVVRRSGPPLPLDSTDLVHEAYLHLHPLSGLDVKDRLHFYRLAARAMRQVLAREARRWQAQKRGGNAKTVALHEVEVSGPTQSLTDQLTVEQVLDRLEQVMPRPAQVVECRLFADLSVEETAQVLDISTATVKRDWRAARAWLHTHLASSG